MERQSTTKRNLYDQPHLMDLIHFSKYNRNNNLKYMSIFLIQGITLFPSIESTQQMMLIIIARLDKMEDFLLKINQKI